MITRCRMMVKKQRGKSKDELNANNEPVSETLRTEVQNKLIFNFQKEEIISLDTPKDNEDKNGMVQEFSSSTKNEDTHVSKIWGRNWRQRTRPKNKSRMNMKAILNSKFQKDVVIIVEESSSDEDLQGADEEYHTMDQTLEEIEKELKNIRELPTESYKDKGKQNNSKFEMSTCSKPSNVEELKEHEDHAHQQVMETLS